MSSLFGQLKRRNVFRVAAAYVIVGWVVLQAASLLLDIFGAPDWVVKTLAALLILGFPLACVFAWAFELTPEGIKRTHEVDEAVSVTAETGRKLDVFILLSMVVLIGLTVWMNTRQQVPHLPAGQPEPEEPQQQTPATPATGAVNYDGIAVLPFVNMSDDPSQVYFSDGLSEELLNVLAGVDGLKVASRTSSFAYKDSPLRLPEIAAELGVTFVLEGSVRKAENRVRITAQLIDTRDDRHLWSETYDRSLNDIFAIQSEIATAIGAALREPLGLDSATVSVAELTGNTDAYALYLEGRTAYTNRYTGASILQAISRLKQSVTLDPDFLQAWQYLASAYGAAPYYTNEIELEPSIKLAREAIDRAIEIDPDDAFNYAIRGFQTLTLEPGWIASALPDLEHALQRDPDHVDLLNWRGQLFEYAGLIERGLADQIACAELEPGYLNCINHISMTLYLLGRNAESAEKSLLLFRSGGGNWGLWDLRWVFDIHGEAAALLYGRSSPHGGTAPLAEWIDFVMKRSTDSERVVRIWDAWAEQTGEEIPAEIWASLGAWDRIELRREGEYFWIWLPEYAEFRSSEKFRNYVNDVGISKVWKEYGYPEFCQQKGTDDFEC